MLMACIGLEGQKKEAKRQKKHSTDKRTCYLGSLLSSECSCSRIATSQTGVSSIMGSESAWSSSPIEPDGVGQFQAGGGREDSAARIAHRHFGKGFVSLNSSMCGNGLSHHFPRRLGKAISDANG